MMGILASLSTPEALLGLFITLVSTSLLPEPQAANKSNAVVARAVSSVLVSIFVIINGLFFVVGLVKSAAAFLYQAFGTHFYLYAVQYSVDKQLAAVGAEFLGKFDIFVDGNGLGDGGAVDELGDGHLDE